MVDIIFYIFGSFRQCQWGHSLPGIQFISLIFQTSGHGSPSNIVKYEACNRGHPAQDKLEKFKGQQTRLNKNNEIDEGIYLA